MIEWARPLNLFTGHNPAAPRPSRTICRQSGRSSITGHWTTAPCRASWRELRQRDTVSARALELLTLTAARTDEVLGARGTSSI